MGYQGQPITIPLNRSGLVHSPNIETISPNSFIHPTRNLILHNDGAEKRTGTAKVNGTAVSGTPRIMGIYDFRVATPVQPFAANDGKIYKDSTTVLKTGMSTSNKFSFDAFNDSNTRRVIICDGANTPQQWDGVAASTSDITSVPTDWTGSNFPAQIFRHQAGSGSHGIALGLSTDKKKAYITPANSPQDYSDANIGTVIADTADDFGLVGGIQFGNRSFLFGREQAFYIDDSDASQKNWTLVPAIWKGGVAHWRLLVKTDKSLIAMMDNGSIYDVQTAESFGDYEQAILTRPSYMDRWIRDNVRLSFIDDFHAVYNPIERAVYFFVVRTGETEINSALVFYIDRPLESAWMVHDNFDNASGYDASASTVVRVGAGDYKIYSGDYGGFIWKHGESDRNDDGNAIDGRIALPYNSFGEPAIKKDFKRVWGIAEAEGEYSATVDWSVDGVGGTQQTISLSGTGAVFDTAKFDTDQFSGDLLIDTSADLGDKGRRLKLEISNNVADQRFYFSSVRVDLKTLGVPPQ